mmetsp:Transcript_16415/g.27810  ORF Transcript_16415/g.27810 Transcript_16415/m.27810 type:complete len:100 (-) Transcript_16415:73-372(-)
MLNGFIQRMDEKLRRHSIGSFGVYGEEGELEQIGVMLWRGSELPEPMIEHPQFEYWNKRKLDVSNPRHQDTIISYLTTNDQDPAARVDDRAIQSWQMYK